MDFWCSSPLTFGSPERHMFFSDDEETGFDEILSIYERDDEHFQKDVRYDCVFDAADAADAADAEEDYEEDYEEDAAEGDYEEDDEEDAAEGDYEEDYEEDAAEEDYEEDYEEDAEDAQEDYEEQDAEEDYEAEEDAVEHEEAEEKQRQIEELQKDKRRLKTGLQIAIRRCQQKSCFADYKLQCATNRVQELETENSSLRARLCISELSWSARVQQFEAHCRYLAQQLEEANAATALCSFQVEHSETADAAIAAVTDAPVDDAPVNDAPVTDAPVNDSATVTDAAVTDAAAVDDAAIAAVDDAAAVDANGPSTSIVAVSNTPAAASADVVNRSSWFSWW